MSTPSKLVVNRLSTAEHVQSSATIHGAAIARAVAAEVDELSVAEVRKVLDALGAHLGRASASMREAEQAYVDEQGDDPAARERRDAALGDVSERFAALREVVRSTAGPGAVTSYGLAGTTPLQPMPLVELASSAIERLRKRPPQNTRLPHVKVDLAAMLDELETSVAELREAHRLVLAEGRELDTKRSVRDAAVERWEQLYPAVGCMLEGLYRLAGRTDLAERIRPTERRARGDETGALVDDGDPSTEPAAGAPAPPGTEPAEPEPAS